MHAVVKPEHAADARATHAPKVGDAPEPRAGGDGTHLATEPHSAALAPRRRSRPPAGLLLAGAGPPRRSMPASDQRRESAPRARGACTTLPPLPPTTPLRAHQRCTGRPSAPASADRRPLPSFG
jgi:hypothetical protein